LEQELSELRAKLSAVEVAQQSQSEKVAEVEKESEKESDKEAEKELVKALSNDVIVIAQGKASASDSEKGRLEFKRDDGLHIKPLG
jgi:hypothetical protein